MIRAHALTLAAMTLALGACNAQQQAQKEAPPRPVLVAPVHYTALSHDRVLPGVVKARTESDLGFRVSGKVAKRLVDAGAKVVKGQPLATLDDADFRLQVDQAEAELSSATGTRSQSEAEEQRVATLRKEGWMSAADVDKIRAAADQARGNFNKAERAVTLARNAVGYATLNADADGVVSAALAEQGQVVAAGAPVIRVAHTDEKEAAVAIPETIVDRVRAAPARVEFWALPGVSITATLRELSPNADSATRTYQARYSLPDAPPNTQLGMSLTVTLSNNAQTVAKLPLGALFDDGKGPTVWVVAADGAVARASVHVSGYDNESAFVVDGVEEGADVVALGAQKIDPSQKVRVVQNLAGL
jgi:RND family efflux transporter MFP subunit